MAEFYCGPVEIEVGGSRPRDHAWFDTGGTISGKGTLPHRDRKSYGGQIMLARERIRITVWTQLAFDLTQALNAAIWRAIERKEPRHD